VAKPEDFRPVDHLMRNVKISPVGPRGQHCFFRVDRRPR
jgi:hypothetical protein